MIKNRYFLNSALILSIALLTGCGGGSDTSTNSTVNNAPSQPHQLSARDLQNVDVLTTNSQTTSLTVTTDPIAKTLTITHFGSKDHDKAHYQFFLNVDNSPDTGYRFNNAVWDNAGTDYIVENGFLFKSTANDSSWSWDHDVGAVSYSENDNSVSVTIEQSLLEGLGPIIRAGFITRNFDWSVKNFYPQSSLMAEFKLDIQPPQDTTAPHLIMNGSIFIRIRKGDEFIDPGVAATDNVDGDITDKVVIESNLDTNTLGTYRITYRVSDAAGNTDQVSRIINVITNTPANIVIDGNKSDWSDKSAVSSRQGVLKAFDTTEKLFLMFDVSSTNATLANTQFFLDTDNNSATGFQFNGSIWYTGGADYMIENNHLDKAQGNSSAWAWDYDTSPIEVAKSDKIIEIAIPKSALTNLEDTIRVGFVNRDEQWTIDPHAISAGIDDYQLENNSVAGNLTLLPNFCGNVWETNGTPESTRISPFNNETSNNDLIIKHKGEWYGVEEHVNADTGENEIHIVRYDGIRKMQFLPLHLVRNEPLGNDKITDMKFLGDALYFVFGNELWTVEDTGRNPRIVKTFEDATIRGLYPSRNFIAIHTKGTVNDQTWIMNTPPNSLEQVFLVDIIGARPLFSHEATNSVYLTDGSRYYKSDYTHRYVTLDFIPFASMENKLYFLKTNGLLFELWVDSNNLKKIISTFDHNPKRFSTKGALYVTTIEAAPVYGGKAQKLWKIDESSAVKTQLNSVSTSSNAGGARNFFRDAYSIANYDYILKGYSDRFTSRLSLNQVGGGTIISGGSGQLIPVSTRPSFSFIDDTLFFTAYDPGSHESRYIGLIDNTTGQPKKLAPCP